MANTTTITTLNSLKFYASSCLAHFHQTRDSISKRKSLVAAFRHAGHYIQTQAPLSFSPGDKYDIAIIGGGIIGLATAREFLHRFPHLSICILEKEKQLALHQSSRNSGVLHAGIYYKPKTYRALFSVQGCRRLIQYCERTPEPAQLIRKTGKLIVAVTDQDLARMDALYERGKANGVLGLEYWPREKVLEREPYIGGALKAIWSPHTAITDFRKIALLFAKELRDKGVDFHTDFLASSFRLTNVLSTTNTQSLGQEIVISSSGSQPKVVVARHMISCAGMYVDRIAAKTGGDADPIILPFRGEWSMVKSEYRDVIKTLIYPVPHPAFPWLGIHFTPKLNGDLWIGPNALLSPTRESPQFSSYLESFRYMNLADVKDILLHPGFPRLIRDYWKTGISELRASLFRSHYIARLQQYVPALTEAWIESTKVSGIRALAVDRSGKLIDDFQFGSGSTMKRDFVDSSWKNRMEFGDRKWDQYAIHVRNAPSPAATSCLLIAEEIVRNAEKRFLLSPGGIRA